MEQSDGSCRSPGAVVFTGPAKKPARTVCRRSPSHAGQTFADLGGRSRLVRRVSRQACETVMMHGGLRDSCAPVHTNTRAGVSALRDGSRAGSCGPARGRRESDSESDNERSCGEQRLLPPIMARADVGRRRSESEPGDSDSVRGIRSRCPAPRVLAHERSNAERTVGAVVASG